MGISHTSIIVKPHGGTLYNRTNRPSTRQMREVFPNL